MIFVTLGTQDKSFKRLLEAVDREIVNGNIKDKVIVQAGYTEYESKNMEIYKLIPMDEFDKYIKECDLLITHAGVGSIMTGLNNNKKIIAAARLSEYGEHNNDHQKEIATEFSKLGYIMYLENFNELGNLEKEANFGFGKNLAKIANYVIIVNQINKAKISEGLASSGFDEKNIIFANNLIEAKLKLKEIAKRGDVVLFENDLPDNYT